MRRRTRRVWKASSSTTCEWNQKTPLNLRYAYNLAGNGRWSSLMLKKKKKPGARRRAKKVEQEQEQEEKDDEDMDVDGEDEVGICTYACR